MVVSVVRNCMEYRWYKIHDEDGILRVPTVQADAPVDARWLVLMNNTLVPFPVSEQYSVADWDGWVMWFSKPILRIHTLTMAGECDRRPWVRMTDRMPPDGKWVLMADRKTYDFEFVTAEQVKGRVTGDLFWYDDDDIKVVHYEKRAKDD